MNDLKKRLDLSPDLKTIYLDECVPVRCLVSKFVSKTDKKAEKLMSSGDLAMADDLLDIVYDRTAPLNRLSIENVVKSCKEKGDSYIRELIQQATSALKNAEKEMEDY